MDIIDIIDIRPENNLDLNNINYLLSMKSLEKEYWKYIDNSSFNFKKPNFAQYIYNRTNIEMPKIAKLCNNYNKWKKTIPTAGIVIIYDHYMLRYLVVIYILYQKERMKETKK